MNYLSNVHIALSMYIQLSVLRKTINRPVIKRTHYFHFPISDQMVVL